MYYAVHDEGYIVAEGATYKECSDNATKACPWGGKPEGEVAPYYITNDGGLPKSVHTPNYTQPLDYVTM